MRLMRRKRRPNRREGGHRAEKKLWKHDSGTLFIIGLGIAKDDAYAQTRYVALRSLIATA